MKQHNYHILIVDDEKLNIELAAAYLKEEGYRLSFALNALAAIESIMNKKIDLILLDINMPGKDGFEVCKILKEDSETKDIPVIFLTAQTDMEYIAKAFRVGGVDYINKPFNGIELLARVKTHLQTMSYMQEIKEKQSKLAQLSITDPLTKIHNTLFFDSQIKNNLSKGNSFWIIYIKLNNFEKINQLYGFNKANSLLKKFAQLLEKVAFTNATVARLNGASFAILTKDYNKKSIKELSETLLYKLLQDKTLKILHYAIIAYHVPNDSTIPGIYKNLQEASEIASQSSENRLHFI